MGQNIASVSRKFSDTWVLRVNTSGAQLTGMYVYVVYNYILTQDFNIIFQSPKEATSGFVIIKKCRFN